MREWEEVPRVGPSLFQYAARSPLEGKNRILRISSNATSQERHQNYDSLSSRTEGYKTLAAIGSPLSQKDMIVQALNGLTPIPRGAV